MIGLDTAVLVRYLAQDEPGQARRASRVVDRAAKAGELLHVSALVLCELSWVLTGAYRLSRDELAGVLRRLLDTPQVDVEDRDVARHALRDFEAGRGDFPDHLLGRRNRARGCRETATFERGVRRMPGFKLLSS